VPETPLVAFNPPGSDPVLPLAVGSAALALVPADVAQGNSYVSTGREIIVVQNTDVAAQTVTVTSAADERNRLGDLGPYQVAAGAIAVLGPFKRQGWARADATVRVAASHANVKLAVVRLPSMP
jgi:hypothetical protein